LEIFFTALALDCAAAALDRMQEGQAAVGLWAATGAAIAACILLRPDGGILLAAVTIYLLAAAAGMKRQFSRSVVAVVIVTMFALGPLVPWTMRNFRTLHHFQPLAPRYATDVDELVPRGFYSWVKTWIADYVSVEEIYWNVPGTRIDAAKLPARAFDSPVERDETLTAIADYNQSQDMTPELDARFGRIAAERIHAHPVLYYVLLPLLRIMDMWLRPRTEILPPDVRWWEFNDQPKLSAMALGFGLVNLAYVAVALLAVVLRPIVGQPQALRWAGLLIGFVLLRSAFLGTLENPEPRYTLECYPVVIVLGSMLLAGDSGRMRRRL
jgi:4-amino-4-deoxy-L-arabinose transferase-like glycosyltransferase